MRPLRSARTLAVALLALAGCAQTVWSTVDGDRMHARVERQVAMGPRIPGSPGHAAMRTWLDSELKRLGADVTQQSFTDSSLGYPMALTNVIARYPARGAGPAATSHRRLLFCAHYDSRPFADRDPDPARRAMPIPGANDGGSGVAVLLELAELMAKTAPPVDVELVFLDGEDQGRAEHGEEFSLGARGYAARLGADKPVAGFLFDMVGDRDLGIYAERTSVERASNLVDLVNDAAAATGGKHFHREVRYQIIDDHIPLLDAGIPTVDLIDFDYGAWHTTRDSPDQVSAASLAEVARVGAWIIYSSPLALSR